MHVNKCEETRQSAKCAANTFRSRTRETGDSDEWSAAERALSASVVLLAANNLTRTADSRAVSVVRAFPKRGWHRVPGDVGLKRALKTFAKLVECSGC